MIYRIEVRDKKNIYDAVGEGVKKDIAELGIRGVKHVRFIQVYFLEGCLKRTAIPHIARMLLADPVTQEFSCFKPFSHEGGTCHIVEVGYNPGVMDPVEASALKALGDLNIPGVDSVRTARKFLIRGDVEESTVRFMSEKLLYNKVIQHIVIGRSHSAKIIPPYRFKLRTVNLSGAGDEELMRLSKTGQLFLNLDEMKAIKGYFSKAGKDPTDCELESIAQTWSEHCKHKTFRGDVDYKGKTIRNLLKSTVMKVTKDLDKKWCVSVFKDNAGVITFDDRFDVCFKVETHNHPSAIEPYGGAGTGIGGVIRDPLGTGLGAKPIMNTDVFCFGPPDTPLNKVPKGTLHPKRVMKGVVGGVRDYGNRMGIPTTNGAVLFDERYIGNPLVYCGNVGILPKNMTSKRVDPGDLVVVVGGRTGRDGIHGATFSSGELTEESETVSGQAVQIGNAITEKKVTDTILQARDAGLYKAITDCGAGGLSSAVGEMGEETGAEIYLDRVPLKYKGLSYTEIWISEAQERMVLAVHPRKVKRLLEVFEAENVEATVIGRFTGTGRLNLFYEKHPVADLSMDFLHNGGPDVKRKAVWKKPLYKEPHKPCPKDLTPYLARILSSWNVASKEWVIRQYDHEVQGGSVLKPLQGIDCDGPGDACVIRPVLDSERGIAVSNGINFLYGLIDPYWMAASCIDEAIRQIIAVGGDIERIALLDNFCWGNTDKPDVLGALVRSSLACYDIAKAYKVPFISGKDSLNNEFRTAKGTIQIPATLLISAIGIIGDVTRTVSMDFKDAGNFIYAAGATGAAMGGSHYWKILGYTGNAVPTVDPLRARRYMKKLTRAIGRGMVRSCHDCSEGGIGVALSEMAFAGGIGADISLQRVVQKGRIRRDDILLFSESNSRFIIEVPKGKRQAFERIMEGEPIALIGETKRSSRVRVEGMDGSIVVDAALSELKAAWQKPFGNW
ncbi:MAG: phosphoribosylformylglycinamidine synthase subunit PurL [Candidatus Omnitrophica bacterium]|nr:phosphoribosylformylglycinamidine synthase subunit PurL [Candidatus Omnitrophota bacterium]